MKLTLSDLGNLNQSAVTVINANFEKIEDAFENTLSRSGLTPNEMTADIDLNGNDVLNVRTLSVDDLAVDTLSIRGLEFTTLYDDLVTIKTITEENAAATAADRIQTGLDRTASANSALNSAASAAASLSSASASLDSENAAEAFALSAEQDQIQTGLDRIQTGQDRQATAADRVQTSADRTATGEDRAATAADRVQTGQDRTAASNSAAQAATFNPARFSRNLDAYNDFGAPLDSNFNDFETPGPIPRLMRGTSAASNAPELNTYYYVLVFAYAGNRMQLALPYIGTGECWTRQKVSGTWTAWRRLNRFPTAAEIGLGNVANKTEAQMVAAGAIADALAAREPSRTATTQAAAEAGTDTTITGWSAQRVRQAAIAANPEVLLQTYTGANLVGQTVLDYELPTGYNNYRIAIDGISTASPGAISLRAGVTGQAHDSGASDYQVSIHGRNGGADFNASAANSQAGVCATGSGALTLVDLRLHDGTFGQWRFLANELSQASDGGLINARRVGVRIAGGVRKRLSIMSSVALQNSGTIKIYGVK